MTAEILLSMFDIRAQPPGSTGPVRMDVAMTEHFEKLTPQQQYDLCVLTATALLDLGARCNQIPVAVSLVDLIEILRDDNPINVKIEVDEGL